MIMGELLLQIIVEKLEAMELLLRHDSADKDREVLREIRDEIKKLLATSLSIDKLNELKVSVDACYKKLESPLQNRVDHQHHLHKGIWIAVVLFFISIFFFWQWINAVENKKQFEGNDIKYRALKVTHDRALMQLLYHTDSLYSLDPEHMEQWVVQEEERLIEQTKLLELAGEKEKEARQLRGRAEKK
jgi:hypothetical protein